MKQLAALLCALILILSIPVAAYADDEIYTEGTLYYTIGDQTINIVGCFGRKEEVTVPASIAGYPVNTICSGAFTNNKYIKKLNLPDVITTIEDGAIADGIKVIYNANTDHPQEIPPDLINGKIPKLVPADTEPAKSDKSAGQNSGSAANGSNGSGSSNSSGGSNGSNKSNDSKASSAASGGSSANSGGVKIMEGEVDLRAEEASEKAAAEAAAENGSGEGSGKTDSALTGENQSDAATSDQPGGGNIWPIVAIAAGVVVVAAVVLFIVIRKKKKSG